MKYLIIDTETSGLNPAIHELLSFGAIVVINQSITETIEIKIKPQHLEKADPEALMINGYSERTWRQAMSQQHAAYKIQDFLYRHQDDITVGHNFSFDKKFIQALANKQELLLPIPYPYLDTMDIARTILAPYGLKSMKLEEICKFLGWKRRRAHSALSDCEDCYKILLNMSPPTWRFILTLKTMNKIRKLKELL
jgi:DNA polymerase-3 subunit epsilon